MYDPVTAQFLQQDTYRGNPGDPLSLNLYTYCMNNPLIYVDPTGHRAQGQVLSYDPDYFSHDVKVLQTELFKRGYLSSESDIDGFFGAKTRKAVYAYQGAQFERLRQQGIYFDVDGLVGDQTWGALGLSNGLGMAENAQIYAKHENKDNSAPAPIIDKTMPKTESVQGTGKEKWTIAEPILDILDFWADTWLESITLGKVGTDELGALALDMYKDRNGVYHARTSAWQQIGGYNDLYDYIFDVGTSMATAKFEFTDDSGRDYMLWAWKGDYINLGAGAELGIYSRDSGILGVVDVSTPHDDHWLVDTNLAMPMTMTLKEGDTVIANYTPSENQWWITSFNPRYKNRKASKLTATYTVNFSGNKNMYNAFIKSDGYLNNKDKWSISKRNKYLLTFEF